MMDETPLLESTAFFVDGAVDHKNRPALRSSSGGWRSAAFIIGVEITERFAYCGIVANLITYLTGPLGQSTATAAANVNACFGASMLVPLLGAFVADAFLGRYRTVVLASLLNILGLGLLTLSTILPSLLGSDCETDNAIPCSPPVSQVELFFFSLYLIVIASGGHKPCTQAFGAEQFDSNDPVESGAKSSLFNWLFFGGCVGTLVANVVVVYIQDNLSWALGYGVSCIVMVIAFVIFLLGTTTYRYIISQNEKGPSLRIGRVFVATFWNRRASSSTVTTDDESHGFVPPESSEQLVKLENKALVADNSEFENDDAKAVVRLIPIWTTCLIYGIVFSQPSTFFTKQGATMERTILPGFKIPAASLLSFISIAIFTFIPIYDRVLVPIARAFTGEPSGITTLQRIGSGIFISVISMVISALVETKRLKTAEEYGLVDKPSATIPMSVWWLVLQYVLCGIRDAFSMVGLQEFFYDQVPIGLRSVGIALYLSVFGVGSFISSFLVSAIDKATSEYGGDSWFSNNLNKAHLDYFYWLLAGLSALGFASFLHFSRKYVYNRRAL